MHCTLRVIQRGLFVFLFFTSLTGVAQVKEFTNPILAGFYPDPSICRGGGNAESDGGAGGHGGTGNPGESTSDYYLVNSSFAYFPGLPIFHSTDLVNWRQIGNAIDRPEQLDLTGAGVSRGLFAPAMRYHKGLYYITCTLVDKGGNFVITAKDPAGPWSNPVWLPEIDGIDPSLFFDDSGKDDSGKAYLIYNSVAPDNKPLYEGHRTIRMREFDPGKLAARGEEKILVNGGTDLARHPVWIEGPHLFKKDAYYYLMAAEGGTEYNHSEVVFRSSAVEGPYEPYAGNPILTQRQLDRARPFPITSTGHADLTETPSGKWIAVFLGCRPYEDDYFNTGRETFMAPVEWKDGWPLINPGQAEVQYHYPVPMPDKTAAVVDPFAGNAVFREDFDEQYLDPALLFLRIPGEKWYSLSERKGWLSVKLLPQTCSGKDNPAFIGHRQQNLKGDAVTALDFSPAADNEKAGMLVFQNENHYYFLCRSTENDQPVVQLYRSLEKPAAAGGQGDAGHAATTDPMELIASQPLPEGDNQPLKLEISAKDALYACYYAVGKDPWRLLKDSVDAKFLSTKTGGGFVGCMYALYATSLNKPSNTKAYFDWFSCTGNDEVYKKYHEK